MGFSLNFVIFKTVVYFIYIIKIISLFLFDTIRLISIIFYTCWLWFWTYSGAPAGYEVKNSWSDKTINCLNNYNFCLYISLINYEIFNFINYLSNSCRTVIPNSWLHASIVLIILPSLSFCLAWSFYGQYLKKLCETEGNLMKANKVRNYCFKRCYVNYNQLGHPHTEVAAASRCPATIQHLLILNKSYLTVQNTKLIKVKVLATPVWHFFFQGG